MVLNYLYLTSWLAVAVSATDPYQYVIDYDKPLEDYEGIKSPKCGPEIGNVEVQKVVKPNQIRLSHTGNPTEMALMWTTNSVAPVDQVHYAQLEVGLQPGGRAQVARALTQQYRWDRDESVEEEAWVYTSGFIHEALMETLQPGKMYFYQIESNGVRSPVYKFIAAPAPGSDTPVSLLHVGDVGTFGTSVMVTRNMMRRAGQQQFHGLVHCGDMAYANKGELMPDMADQQVWDTWGQMVEPLSSKIPYMTVPGNHEVDPYESTWENGTIYDKRFKMPGNEHYYKFSIGMVMFVAVSTDMDIKTYSTQGLWLNQTLYEISQERDLYPWLVLFQHRPIYNSNRNHGNWSGVNNYTYKDGTWHMPEYRGWPDDYEALILKYNVDLVLAGHVHHYERSWPVQLRNDVTQSYEEVKKPVHITCGHGGKSLYQTMWDTDGIPTYRDNQPHFTASRTNAHWGHCEMEFKDRRTAVHRMYKMGEAEPDQEVVITRHKSRVVEKVSGAGRGGVGVVLVLMLWRLVLT